MIEEDQPVKEPCKLFKLLGEDVPDFCDQNFSPKVEWQKFCSNKNKCHDRYWKIIYQEKTMVNTRLERLEKEAGLKQ